MSQEDFEIQIRDKRFISKLICEGIVGGGCKGKINAFQFQLIHIQIFLTL